MSYAYGLSNNSIYVIDTSTNLVTATIYLGSSIFCSTIDIPKQLAESVFSSLASSDFDPAAPGLFFKQRPAPTEKCLPDTFLDVGPLRSASPGQTLRRQLRKRPILQVI